jgi:hypothetical protein
MMYDDDEKKKKKDKVTKHEANASGITFGSTRKRKSLVAAIGNTDAFQSHINRKDKRIWKRKYKDERDYSGYNKEMAERNNRLAEKGINARHGYRF